MELNTIKERAKELVKDWLASIFVEKVVSENENLIEKGLSSIQVMQLSGKLKKTGIKISFAKLMEEPNLSKWYELIDKSRVKSDKNIESSIIQSDESKFDLTDIQYSYLIGREDDQILGGVGCHAYLEIDGENINEDKLKEAWNKLQYRHPMLRAKFTKDGHQEILHKPYSEEIEVFDLSDLDEETLHLKLVEIREQKSHRKLNVNQGQVAGVALAKFSDEKSRIFFDVDLLVSDVMSMSIMIKELAELYSGVELDNLNEYTFKDYIQNRIGEAINDEDKEFWKQKINTFEIERPNLPLRKQPEQIKETKFTRRKRIIKKDEWETIKDIAASYQSTPSMVLLTAYSLVLERWCNQDKFFINIPLFNRDLENENLKEMIADFTNILLVEHESVDDARFLDALKRTNKTFLENVSHSAYSGVQVQRDISKDQGTSVNIAPVVFACNIDYPLETKISRKNLGKVSYMISQTPGVWLDFQTYIVDGNLILCWDSVDELFPTGMLEDMMDSLYELIISLTQKEEWEKKVDVLPEKQKSIRKQDVEEILPLQYPNEILYDGFLRNVKLNPDRVAIIDSETKEQITYHKLYEISLKVADYLGKNGVKKGDYVGVTLPRGSIQLYAIFGILFTGAAYVSIGITQPNDRRTKIYDQIGIKHIVSNEKTIIDCGLDKNKVKIIDLDVAVANESKLEQPVEISPYDSAYIIMTSGTTGIPKGVEIMHTSAVNTCIDLNEKYNINSGDTILMVSAIDFDLSVYDIFGILRAGGTVVTTNEENYRDPDEWLKLVDEYKVTIWDSVPILFDMIVTMAEGKNGKLPFRIVMLSGDWIAINLPERFYNISENINSIVVAMGGATEASIWSNYLNVPREIPKDWISIPYGRPLKNQVYRVVDEFCRICPNYVKGELLIGGVGVAKCYHGDEELTKKKYFEKDKIRWYRTGDNGRTWNDRTIEFLGRKDSQTKIKGHRIELGEIEEAIRKFPDVDNAVVDYISDNSSNKRLISFVKLKEDIINDDYIGIVQEYKNLGTDLKKAVDIGKLSMNYDDFIYNLNRMCLRFIINCFKDIGIDFSSNTNLEKEIQNTLFISTKGKKIISSWIDILEKFNVLKLDEDGYRCNNYENIFVKIENEQLEKINSYFLKMVPDIKYILSDEKNPLEVLHSRNFRFYDILKNFVGYDELKKNILQIIKQVKKQFKGRQIRLLELGTRDIEITSDIVNELEGSIAKYVYVDNSEFYRNDFKELLEKDFFEYEVVKEEIVKKFSDNSFDIVISINSLHRNNLLNFGFDISKVLTSRGLLLITEIKNTSIFQETILGMIDLTKNYNDSNEKIEPIVTMEQVTDILNDFNYDIMYSTERNNFEFSGNMVIVALNQNKQILKKDQLNEFLKELIPSYMIPDIYYTIQKFPLNKNGKIDRKKLRNLSRNCSKSKKNLQEQNEEYSDVERNLCEIWSNVLSYRNVFKKDNYFNIGGDSLTATEIAGKISSLYNVKISVKDIFENPTIEKLSNVVENRKKQHIYSEGMKNQIIVDTDNRYKPFPLTDIQFAYWMGKNGGHNLSDISTNCYFEVELKNIEIGKLEKSFNELIKKHDMMKAIILNEGQQQILSNVPYYKIQVSDLSDIEEEQILDKINTIRNEIYNKIIQYDKWPLFEVRVTKLKKDIVKLHVRFENIIFDGWSMFYVLKQWQMLYDGKLIPDTDISYRDYVLALEKLKHTKKYIEDRDYWEDRIESFPEYPKLPLMNHEGSVKKVRFVRKDFCLSENKWNIFKEICKKYEVTTGAALITAYSETLKKWSSNKHFALNITRFDREQLHNDINGVIGDFTTLNLLEIKEKSEESLYSKITDVQNQLLDDISHSLYSSIEFERKIRKKTNNYIESVMPIVFTSGIGIDDSREEKWIDNLSYSISQSSQVWLDHQVFVLKGGLYLSWDYIEELFEENTILKMFDDYKNIIDLMIQNDNWDNLYVDTLYSDEVEIEVISSDKNVKKTLYENVDIVEKSEFHDIEYKVIKLFEKVLSTEYISNNSNFFIEGGDSLKVVRLVRLLNEKFDIQLNIKTIFEKSTPSELAEFISSIRK